MGSIKLYTIGFTKKNAKTFFSLLCDNNVKALIDVRLNNVSQLAGFTKKDDLEFFLQKICNIKYRHNIELSPTKEILEQYKKRKISWTEYENQFNALLMSRKIEKFFSLDDLNDACLLCSEPDAKYCHRRLVAEYFKSVYPNIEIIHL